MAPATYPDAGGAHRYSLCQKLQAVPRGQKSGVYRPSRAHVRSSTLSGITGSLVRLLTLIGIGLKLAFPLVGWSGCCLEVVAVMSALLVIADSICAS